MARRIRDASTADAEALLGIYAPAILESAISFETDLPPVEEFGARIARTLAKTPWLVCEEKGAIAGYAYASEHRERKAYRWSVEVSVYVAASARGRGVGRALYTELFAILRRLGYVNAYAGITLPNPASVRLHELLGFAPVGVYRKIGYKFGAWHDVGWWQLALGEHPREPRPPTPYLSTE